MQYAETGFNLQCEVLKEEIECEHMTEYHVIIIRFTVCCCIHSKSFASGAQWRQTSLVTGTNRLKVVKIDYSDY
jgi:hypothetical protein